MLKYFWLFAVAVLFACDYNYSREKEISGKPIVYFTLGSVTINNNPVKLGQEILNGDLIATGDESSLEVKFGRQSAFRVREQSQVVFNYDKGIQLNVIKGKVLNILEKNSNFKVRTPTAVAAVRGTIFFTSIIDANKSYFCACNGTIAIEDENQSTLTNLSSAHHQSNFSERADGQLQMNTASMMQHDDLEIFDFMYRLDNALKKPAK